MGQHRFLESKRHNSKIQLDVEFREFFVCLDLQSMLDNLFHHLVDDV